jgi:hypothetical protein
MQRHMHSAGTESISNDLLTFCSHQTCESLGLCTDFNDIPASGACLTHHELDNFGKPLCAPGVLRSPIGCLDSSTSGVVNCTGTVVYRAEVRILLPLVCYPC